MKPLEEQSFYELLDVPVDVTQAALDRAFEQAMQFYGPDSMAVYTLVDPAESARLVEKLEEAYLTLSDPTLRQEYDARLGTVSASLQAVAVPAEPSPPVAVAPPEAPEPGQLELRPILKAARLYPGPAAVRSAEEATSPVAEPSASARLTALLGAIPPAEPMETDRATPVAEEERPGMVLASQAVQHAGDGAASESLSLATPAAPADEPPMATAAAAAREVPVVRPASPRSAGLVPAARPAVAPAPPTEPAVKSAAAPRTAPPPPAVAVEAPAPAPAPSAEPPRAPAPEPKGVAAEEPRTAAAPAPTPTPKPGPKPLEIPADAVFNGELLRRIRESRGLALRELADRTRIGSMHLENIEADRYEQLPATVYLRGFLMAYARELRLDPLKVSKSYLDVAAAARGGAARPGPKP